MKIIERAKKSRLNVIETLSDTADKLKEKGNHKEEIKVRKEIISKIEELIEQFNTGRLEMLQAMSDLASAHENLYQCDKALAVRKDVLERCSKWFDENGAFQNIISALILAGKAPPR